MEFPSGIVGLGLHGETWKSFFSYDAGMTTEMGVYPLGPPGKFAILRQSFPGTLRLVQVDGGKTLKEIQHGRALVRNLLKFIDGFFNFMVGILLAALSENWQRVGDMAARTVVVRVRREMVLDVE